MEGDSQVSGVLPSCIQVTVGITRTGIKLDSSKTSEGHRDGATANI